MREENECTDLLARVIASYLLVTGDYSVVDKLAHATKELDVIEAINASLREFPRVLKAYRDKEELAYDYASRSGFERLIQGIGSDDVETCLNTAFSLLKNQYRLYGAKIATYALGYLLQVLLEGCRR